MRFDKISSHTIKSLIYALCFAGICIIDMVRGSGDGAQWAIAVNCTGLVLFPVIICGHHLEDYKKWPYLVWTILSVIGMPVAIIWGQSHYLLQGKWITGVINVVLCGYLVIHMQDQVLVRKILPKLQWKMICLWAVMLLLMTFSRSEALWPGWFLILFGALLLNDYSEEEQDTLFHGMVNGLILGFFVVQGMAFMFRPFDVLWYKGMYGNMNVNGLFYFTSYLAFLSKWSELRQKHKPVWMKVLCVFLAGSLWGFTFMTICRTVLIAMAVLTLFFLVLEYRKENEKILRKILASGVSVLLCAVVSFPLVFGAVRYLPPVFHHPIWYGNEWNESKVHSWDPWDSPKYVNWDGFWSETMHELFHIDITSNETSRLEPSITYELQEMVAMNGPLRAIAEKLDNVSSGRLEIYKYFLQKLTWTGLPDRELYGEINGFFLYHAHCTYLTMAVRFGVISGILFLIAVAYGVLRTCSLLWKKAKQLPWYYISAGLFTIAFALYALVEMNGYSGMDSLTLFFFAQVLLLRKREC